MDSVLTLAIAKGLKAKVVKEASAEVGAGTYPIDALVRVQGTLTKGEDYSQIQHMKVDQWGLIAVLLSKVNGITMESVVREINGIDPSAITKIKAQAQEAMNTVKAPADKLTAGKVTSKLSITLA